MAEEFFDPDIPIDSEDLADDQFAYLEEQSGGAWRPAAGNLDTWILEAGARLGSEVGTLALIPPSGIFRTMGTEIDKLLPIDDTPATATSTWTLGDTDGHDIESGTVVAIENVAFEVVTTVNVPSGSTVANNVELIAVDPGAAGSGLVGPVELVDNTGYEAAIALDAPTANGQDGETDEEYLDRLARERELSAPRPLNARDVENFAKRVVGIERSLVLDNYKPGPPYDADPEAEDVPLVFTVVPIDEVGQPVTAGTRAVLQQTLESNRGTNWRIFIIDPTYTTVDVYFEVITYKGLDPVAVRLAVIEAINNFLSPALWGQPAFGEQRTWVQTAEVRHRELAAAIDRVEGVDSIPVLQLRLAGGVFAENVDLALAGRAPLVEAGAVDGTVDLP